MKETVRQGRNQLPKKSEHGNGLFVKLARSAADIHNNGSCRFVLMKGRSVQGLDVDQFHDFPGRPGDIREISRHTIRRGFLPQQEE